jgi:hypothetical protein
MSERYLVKYTCPVYAVVEDGRVVRVMVGGDEISTPTEVLRDSDGTVITNQEATEAVRAAEADQFWPPWDFG